MAPEKIHRAIQLVKTGQKDAARTVLLEVVRDEPRNEFAWLWLAETYTSYQQRMHILEKCVELIPGSVAARRALSSLVLRQTDTELPPEPPQPPAYVDSPFQASIRPMEAAAVQQPDVFSDDSPIPRQAVVMRPTESAPEPTPRLRMNLETILIAVLVVLAIGVAAVLIFLR